ncbi:abscisic acid receptor PYL12-like [Argentina anserina]|uniref:abscisic acid receptor PYL12-like n=1 Tax=Argentina anserina TaxID=57926 RepID=UPI00217641C6|nr:abscisic acid receptor PYL12-like [Potentilla anserina]
MESYHCHALLPNQCGSSLVQTINAPLPLVWSVLRQFDKPQVYKQFISSCKMCAGDGGIGSIREVEVHTGLPAKTSMERLDRLDDDKHVINFSIVGGEHKLVNYSSTTTVNEDKDRKTLVIQSYVVDVPAGSSKEDTCLFTNTIIQCNLRSLAKVTERMSALDKLVCRIEGSIR